jgi:hypothetical protein|tara:strand:+ start:3167 stop:3907 length:741 start_codon:yes stop_codon:yes gene_type:complete
MVNINDLKKKYDEIKNLGKPRDNSDFLSKFFMMEEGTSVVRVLPSKDDEGQFYSETAIHRINDRNHHCPRIKGGECPICDLYFRLWKEPGDDLHAVAREIKARRRYYLNVIDRRDEKVKILSVGQKLFEKVLDCFFDEDYGDISDLKAGWDFKITKDTQGQWPNYDKSAPKPKQSEAGTDSQIATWMDELHDIAGLVKIATYEDLKNMSLEIESAVGLGGPPSGQGTPASSDDDGDYLSHLKDLKS